MKNLLKLTTLSLVTTSAIYAGGYKIPETSVNGMALSAATVAHSIGADAAYYNPANMVFMKNENAIEADLIFINLDATNFKGKGNVGGTWSADSDINAKSETFLIPSINYVSSEYGKMRFGLSVSVPGGLTKRWTDSPAKDSAEEFTLQVVEINPTVAYPINDKLAVAFGLRVLHSEGIVKSSSAQASRDMTGDSYDFGYNIALAYKPTSSLEIGMTYRSNVDLTEEGNAKLDLSGVRVYDGGSSVSVPLPALFNLAVAYTFETKTTVEFVYEKNFWSAYSDLDFNYASSITPALQPVFDDPISKDWKDTTAYRLGLTQELDKLTLMAGVVIDETPVPDAKVSFELPDSDSLSVSLGARYELNKQWNTGFGMLYSMRKSRIVNNDTINGEFSNSNVFMLSAGVGYTF